MLMVLLQTGGKFLPSLPIVLEQCAVAFIFYDRCFQVGEEKAQILSQGIINTIFL